MDIKRTVKSHIDNALKFIRLHRVIAAVTVAVMVMTMLMSFVIIRRNDVEIYVDGIKVANFTTLKSEVSEWLEQSGITVSESDIMTVEDSTVRITRAFYVTVEADGGNITVKTLPADVKEILDTVGVTVSETDILSHPLDTVIKDDAKITVTRVTTDTVTEYETVKYTTKKVKTDDLYVGETKVETEGENGKIEYVYSVTYTDGEETERTLVSKTVVKEAVEKTVLVGTKVKSSFKKTSSTPKTYKKVIAMSASAYTYGNDGGNVTATGIATCRGIVAVDPRVIPLGTKLYIESEDGKYIYGTAVASDTGGAIKGNRIDLFVESERECRAFGRRTVNVYILD